MNNWKLNAEIYLHAQSTWERKTHSETTKSRIKQLPSARMKPRIGHVTIIIWQPHSWELGI